MACSTAPAPRRDPAWIYAIIRQEKRLPPRRPITGRRIGTDANHARDWTTDRSRAMQDTARTPDLLQADLNIRYGAHYLQRLLGQAQSNPSW